MPSRMPIPPVTISDSQCGKCGIEVNLGDPPQGIGCVWVVCPDCGLRFWKEERSAVMVLGLHGLEDAPTRYQPGITVH